MNTLPIRTIHSTDRVVVIYSGGMDSYTLLHHCLHHAAAVYALSFDYGQRHRKELEVSRAVTRTLGLPHQVIDIRTITPLLGGSALTDQIDVPEGHYEDASMRSTVVPNRNMILISLAIGWAVSLGADAVAYGAHGGDHAIYPDCRPAFVAGMNAVGLIADYTPCRVLAPWIDLDKGEILQQGLAMNLDYRQTWTCYNGRELACGRCGACVERLEAFARNGARDPLPYEPLSAR